MQSALPELFTLAERRLAWTSERQTMLARDIANLSTPGFQAVDAPDFQTALARSGAFQPARTSSGHMDGTIDPGSSMRPVRERRPRTPDDNGVRLEEQLMKVADTETLHATVTSIYKKYMSMLSTALGRSG
jgi:flagellar basal-body rod protein FlgB